MVDPAGELAQRLPAFVQSLQRWRAAVHGRQEQHLIGWQPPLKALTGFYARGASGEDRAWVRHASLFKTTLQLRSECARIGFEPRTVLVPCLSADQSSCIARQIGQCERREALARQCAQANEDVYSGIQCALKGGFHRDRIGCAVEHEEPSAVGRWHRRQVGARQHTEQSSIVVCG